MREEEAQKEEEEKERSVLADRSRFCRLRPRLEGSGGPSLRRFLPAWVRFNVGKQVMKEVDLGSRCSRGCHYREAGGHTGPLTEVLRLSCKIFYGPEKVL